MSRSILALLLCVLLAAFLAACAPATPEVQPEAIFTSAAQTVEFKLTLEAGATAVAQLTQIAGLPSPTPTINLPILPTLTDTPRPTHTPSLVAPAPTPTVYDQGCNLANFVGDVSVSDGASFTPGTVFVKTWRIRNTGTCTWTPGYSLVFLDGDDMDGPSLVGLAGSVRPGETVDVSVQLAAPQSPGFYQGRWMLRSADNRFFSAIPGDLDSLWVRIRVSLTLSPGGFSYQFADNLCAAQWTGAQGGLPCPGVAGSSAGSALVLQAPNLETRQEDEPAIWLRPAQGRNGWISGEYPPYRVRPDDHFVAEIGCLSNSPDCELLFQLDYRTNDGRIWTLDAWDEVYDDDTTLIDLDLSDLAGLSVQFIFTLTNEGNWQDADGFWFMPVIERLPVQTGLVLTWRQIGGIREACEELRIYLTGQRSAEARASTCKNGVRELGRGTLNSQDLNQLLGWLSRLRSFDGEIARSSGGEPLTGYISFQGSGTVDAQSGEIQAINDLANRIYTDIAH